MKDGIDEMGIRVTPAAMSAFGRGDLANFMVASTPGGIERQEAEGQARLVESVMLPREHNGRFELNTKNPWNVDARDSKHAYEKMGIQVTESSDKLFFDAVLPEGWKLQPTDHSMWSDVIDERGRKRIAIFFKAAFYDYKAHFNIKKRFEVQFEYIDRYESQISHEEREKMPKICRVYDAGVCVFESEKILPVQPTGDRKYAHFTDEDESRVREEGRAWLEARYPEHNNPFLYWDEKEGTDEVSESTSTTGVVV